MQTRRRVREISDGKVRRDEVSGRVSLVGQERGVTTSPLSARLALEHGSEGASGAFHPGGRCCGALRDWRI